MREDKLGLERELAAARETISNSTIPNAATLVQAEDRIRELLEQKEKLERKCESVQGTLDYTRDAYQKVRNLAFIIRSQPNETFGSL